MVTLPSTRIIVRMNDHRHVFTPSANSPWFMPAMAGVYAAFTDHADAST
jgi:hypothetical protein